MFYYYQSTKKMHLNSIKKLGLQQDTKAFSYYKAGELFEPELSIQISSGAYHDLSVSYSDKHPASISGADWPNRTANNDAAYTFLSEDRFSFPSFSKYEEHSPAKADFAGQ